MYIYSCPSTQLCDSYKRSQNEVTREIFQEGHSPITQAVAKAEPAEGTQMPHTLPPTRQQMLALQLQHPAAFCLCILGTAFWFCRFPLPPFLFGKWDQPFWHRLHVGVCSSLPENFFYLSVWRKLQRPSHEFSGTLLKSLFSILK